jgi:hypothetical protein
MSGNLSSTGGAVVGAADIYKLSVNNATVAALPACTPAGAGAGKTLTGNVAGALTVDGLAVLAGHRILVKNQVDPIDNGIYTVTEPGTTALAFILTRTTDFDTTAKVTAASEIPVRTGTINARKSFVLTTTAAITVDTTGMAFAEVSAANKVPCGRDTSVTTAGTAIFTCAIACPGAVVGQAAFASMEVEDTGGNIGPILLAIVSGVDVVTVTFTSASTNHDAVVNVMAVRP